MLASVERLSVLEGELKRKDGDLELSRGVVAQCRDLQSRVDQFQYQLDERQFEVDWLKGEVVGKQQLIEEAESSRRQARRTAALLSW